MPPIINTQKVTNTLKIIRTSFWYYRRRFIVTTILGFVTGLFGGIGIGAVIPLFALVGSRGGVNIKELDSISQFIQDGLAFFHIPYNLFYVLGLVLILFILKGIITYCAFYYNEKVSADYEMKMRSELFKKTLKADWPYLVEQKTGYLESILMYDVHACSGILGTINAIIMTLTSLIAYTIVAINISLSLTILTLAVSLVIFLLVKPLMYGIRKEAHKLSDVNKNLNHHISQHALGSKTVKVTATEDQIIDDTNSYLAKLRQIRLKISAYNRAPGSFIEPVGLFYISGLFTFEYLYNTNFNIASFAATIYLIQKILAFSQALHTQLNGINEALPYLQVISDYEKRADSHRETNTGILPFEFKDKLEINNITFGYNNDVKILNNLSFSLKRGEMIGIIGPSGVGKTTLVDILLRLFELGAGEILIDGKSISKIDLFQWRSKVGYVSQEIFLLNDTVENNIRFYNDVATAEEIMEATKISQAYDFINELPDKFQTLVGENGIKLSAGQRQRIILARVLLRKPEILILDEATSALDNESEVNIQKSIDELKRSLTVIAIAHRLSTVTSSDRLIVMNNGTITEQGSPAELLKNKDSYFYKVYNIR